MSKLCLIDAKKKGSEPVRTAFINYCWHILSATDDDDDATYVQCVQEWSALLYARDVC